MEDDLIAVLADERALLAAFAGTGVTRVAVEKYDHGAKVGIAVGVRKADGRRARNAVRLERYDNIQGAIDALRTWAIANG